MKKFRRYATIPTKDLLKDFCEFMGYEFFTQANDTFYYKVPAGHVCVLYVNAHRWKNGEFDKEKFLRDRE